MYFGMSDWKKEKVEVYGWSKNSTLSYPSRFS
jgi:hypothetical protein